MSVESKLLFLTKGVNKSINIKYNCNFWVFTPCLISL